GTASEFLLDHLQSEPHELPHPPILHFDDPFVDDDLHLALYLCYELHYRGLPGVDERWEWEPSLLALRRELERPFERALLDAIPLAGSGVPVQDVHLALRAITEQGGPSVST